MAFSLESIAAAPLLFALLLQPVILGPKAGVESVEQAREVIPVTISQVNPDTFYRLYAPSGSRLTAVQASPQLMLEVVGLAKDFWRPVSSLFIS